MPRGVKNAIISLGLGNDSSSSLSLLLKIGHSPSSPHRGIVCVVEAAGVLYAGGGCCFMDVVVLEGRVGVEGDGDGGVWSWLGTQGFLEGEEVCMLRGGGGFRGVVNCAGISIVRGILKVKGGECVVEFVMARV